MLEDYPLSSSVQFCEICEYMDTIGQVYQWDLCNIASDDIEVGKSSLPSLLLDIFSLLVRVGQSFDSAAWEPEQRQ